LHALAVQARQVDFLQSGDDCDHSGGRQGATHATSEAAVLQGSTVLQTFQHGWLVL